MGMGGGGMGMLGYVGLVEGASGELYAFAPWLPGTEPLEQLAGRDRKISPVQRDAPALDQLAGAGADHVARRFQGYRRQAFTVEMTSREDLLNAISLNSAMFNGARIIGPAIAGFVYERAGLLDARSVSTSDLLPADILGVTIFNQDRGAQYI